MIKLFGKPKANFVYHNPEYKLGEYVIKLESSGRFVLYRQNSDCLYPLSNHATEKEAINAFENIKASKNYVPKVLGSL